MTVVTIVTSGNATAAPVISATFSLNMLLLTSRVLFNVIGSRVKPVCVHVWCVSVSVSE